MSSQVSAEWESWARVLPAIREGIEIPRSKLLSDAVALLVHHGWDVKVAMSQNAQLERRRGVRPMVGGAMICMFSVIGMAAVMIQIANARQDRIDLQVHAEDEIRVLHGGRNVTITDLGELEFITGDTEPGLGYLAAAGIGFATLIFWATLIHLL